MTFNNLDLPLSVTTGYQNPNTDFFIPVLGCSRCFYVAVGYFTSGWLKDVLEGMKLLALQGGKCHFIVSPNLDPLDAIILANTEINNHPNGNCLNSFEQIIFEDLTMLDIDARTLLSNLICSGICDFKIALPKREGPNLFHAKIGYACDELGSELAFNGSFNFTLNAKTNWEYIDIYRDDSIRDKQRIDSIKARFENLWSNSDTYYEVYSASKILKKNIEKFTSPDIKSYHSPSKPVDITLRPYQEQAIQAWGDNGGKGMFVMATGSGKTITALSVVRKVLDRFERQAKPLLVIFILPLKHLLDQWHEEAKMFNFDALKCYETSAIWKTQLSEKLAHQSMQKSGVVMAMVTNATLSSTGFQMLINSTNSPIMVVADEAHNLGSAQYLASLPTKAIYRLGLTATPDRFNDPKGTQALIKYFDKVIFEFSLEDAINQGFLVPYNYFPFTCEFNHEEFNEYKTIVAKLEAEETSLVEAEFELEMISSGAKNKLVILRRELEILLTKKLLKHTLIYCGSHKDDEGSRQIEKVIKILGTELEVKTRKFTADESVSERRQILEQFAIGNLDSIVAIKCLDEGVDVPATKQAFVLSSTSNPREFIQRRGRILRRSDGKDEANIYDFIMVPPSGEVNTHLVTKEVKRGLEYNSLAKNRSENIKLFEHLIYMHDVELAK